MTVSAKQMKSRLTPAERKAVEKRAAALISEEMRLRELRASLALTQERLAERMKVGQETVSRIESQSTDMRVSSIAKYVAGRGGELDLVARFPDRTVTLRDLRPLRRAQQRKATKTKTKTKTATAGR
jgi:transcriptional regulator with XRE-family HTH domain